MQPDVPGHGGGRIHLTRRLEVGHKVVVANLQVTAHARIAFAAVDGAVEGRLTRGVHDGAQLQTPAHFVVVLFLDHVAVRKGADDSGQTHVGRLAPLILQECREVGHPVVDALALVVDLSDVGRGGFGRKGYRPAFADRFEPANEHVCRRNLIVGALRIDRRRHGSRVGERRVGITDSPVVDYGVGFLQVEVASLIAVEISFDVELVVSYGLVSADYAEKQRRPGGSCAERPVVARIGVKINQVGRESARIDRASPVVVAAQAHAATDTHGELCILAHKEEVGCGRVLEMAELVVVECIDKAADAVGVGFGYGMVAVDYDNLVAGLERVKLLVDVVGHLCRGGENSCRRGDGE